MNIFNRLQNPAETMLANGRSAGSVDQTVATAQATDAAKEAMEKALSPLLKPIYSVVDRLTKLQGSLQQACFQVCRATASKAFASIYFKWIEAKICEHLAIRDCGGQLAWDALSKDQRDDLIPKNVAGVPGLASWTATKGALMQGYEIYAKLGKNSVVCGKLDPTIAKYAGEDGASQWMADIRACVGKAQKEYQDKLNREVAEKIAAANKADDKSEDSASTDGQRDVRSAPITFLLPEKLQVSYNKLTRVIQESVKFKARNQDLFTLSICGIVDRAAVEIARTISLEADAIRTLAVPVPPSKTDAAAELQMRRSLMDQPIEEDVHDDMDTIVATTLAEIDDGVEEDLETARALTEALATNGTPELDAALRHQAS